MQMTAHGKKRHVPYRKLLFLFCFSFILFNSGFSQNISLSLKKVPLEKAFKEIETRINQRFVYTREMMNQSHVVIINVKDAPLKSVLDLLFKDQPLEFSVDEQFIKVRFKTQDITANQNLIDVQGKVLNEKGEPLANVSVTAIRTNKFSITDEDGNYFLHQVLPNDEIIFTSIGYSQRRILINGRTRLETQLSVSINELDRTLVIAYGTTTQRLNTGNVVKVSGEEIEKQPVTNPLAALEGRVPGLFISQTSGVPGSSFKIEMRGQSVLDQSLSRNDPLIVIDGVPFEAGNTPINQLISAANNPTAISQGGISPMNTINPQDIESIEVLKDADATAIYGSRGANGVILITTKKGKTGKTNLGFNIYEGWSKAVSGMKPLDTRQYLQMRHEAFLNDGIVPDATIAPDLFLWDTTRYTNFRKLLVSNIAHSHSIQLSLSGGSSLTQFSVGANYHRETNVFSSDLNDEVAGARMQVNHTSENKKLNILTTASYNVDRNNLTRTDLSRFMNLPPIVKLYDSTGKLVWGEGGVFYRDINNEFTNPLAELQKRYKGENGNLFGNITLSYEVLNGLVLRASGGYNSFSTEEVSTSPSTSLDPSSGLFPSSQFAHSIQRSWIIEPQAEWKKKWKEVNFSFLSGSTFQNKNYSTEVISADNFANDLLLNSVRAAGTIAASNNQIKYRYSALFSRVHFDWRNRYIINLNGRRDGSSRFSPETRFSNFGSIGTAWLFYNEKWFKVPFISYGKIRGSYGVTGNDQIGDYKYLNLWTNTSQPYGGVPGVVPKNLYNPHYNWEKNKKLELGIELGILNNSIQLTASYYRNRSSNQLINYSLPTQTGFFNVVQNLPAFVQNTGLEVTANVNLLRNEKFKWSSAFNITIPKNKLVSFPNLASSPYASVYKEGQSLNTIYRFKYLGVDPATGLYTFDDLDKDGFWTENDYQLLGNLDPKFYGGFSNSISYKGFSLSFLIEFKKQLGNNYLSQLASYVPGTIINQPAIVLNRWQKQGDNTNIQRFSSDGFGPAYTSLAYLSYSNGIYSDASYARLKNAYLGFQFPNYWLKKVHVTNMKFYAEGQNLFTVTNYEGTDPESQNFYVLPPLRTIAFGVQLNF